MSQIFANENHYHYNAFGRDVGRLKVFCKFGTTLLQVFMNFSFPGPSSLASDIDLRLESTIELVESQRFGVEYQPIVAVASGEIIAFEALARFYDAAGKPVPTIDVFETLHSHPDLLVNTELALKKLQIDNAPGEYRLFLNLDPHAVDCDASSPCELMSHILNCQQDVVVELIENSDIHEARMSMLIHDVLTSQGIETALDDIGADHALLSLDILLRVNYLKLDRSWLEKIQQPHYLQMFKALLGFARDSGKKSVLEGIEKEHQLELAKKSAIPLVQGFLYRPRFKSVKP